mmetsp:Transcript_128603/g.274337  ORF Transcript_128603/g.274337 Transcript_128603/m.274337 type:complete len:218 (+) Transcript_128603:824-1477(+)
MLDDIHEDLLHVRVTFQGPQAMLAGDLPHATDSVRLDRGSADLHDTEHGELPADAATAQHSYLPALGFHDSAARTHDEHGGASAALFHDEFARHEDSIHGEVAELFDEGLADSGKERASQHCLLDDTQVDPLPILHCAPLGLLLEFELLCLLCIILLGTRRLLLRIVPVKLVEGHHDHLLPLLGEYLQGLDHGVLADHPHPGVSLRHDIAKALVGDA